MKKDHFDSVDVVVVVVIFVLLLLFIHNFIKLSNFFNKKSFNKIFHVNAFPPLY